MGEYRIRYETEGSYFSGLIWFIFLSILIGWFYPIGTFCAAFIAGRKSGGVGAALLVVLTPTAIVAIVVAVLVGGTFGAEAGALSGGLLAIILAAFGIVELIGALVGGMFVSRKPTSVTSQTGSRAAAGQSSAPQRPSSREDLAETSHGGNSWPIVFGVMGVLVIGVIAVAILAGRSGEDDAAPAQRDAESSSSARSSSNTSGRQAGSPETLCSSLPIPHPVLGSGVVLVEFDGGLSSEGSEYECSWRYEKPSSGFEVNYREGVQSYEFLSRNWSIDDILSGSGVQTWYPRSGRVSPVYFDAPSQQVLVTANGFLKDTPYGWGYFYTESR